LFFAPFTPHSLLVLSRKNGTLVLENVSFLEVYSKVYPLSLLCEEKKQKLKRHNRRALLKRGVKINK
jgi:hypothetical protein